jgi:hypothetical protein
MMQPVKAPWIRPGVVVHDQAIPVDHLLADFARSIQTRGFAVGGLVRSPPTESRAGWDLLDLGSGTTVTVDSESPEPLILAMASRCLRGAMRDDADLVAIGGFAAFQHAARELKTTVGRGLSPGLPVLTSIDGQNLHQWHDTMGLDGAMLAPTLDSLWRWWGPDRLYRDLALGVADHEVHRLVCGRRWLMVEGPFGTGLATLPKNPAPLIAELPKLRRRSLRALAGLCQSWDPLEMAVSIAAINAHYNRFDLHEVAADGDGATVFRHEPGRVVVVGGFPGQAALFPRAQVIDVDPQPGEYPIVAIDTLVPGCAAAVVTSSTLINRNLPRILRLTHGSRVALIGPATPLTPRLYEYGLDVLGGLVVRDSRGLASAIEAGAGPPEFTRFGATVHLRRQDAEGSALLKHPAPGTGPAPKRDRLACDIRFSPDETRQKPRAAGKAARVFDDRETGTRLPAICR